MNQSFFNDDDIGSIFGPPKPPATPEHPKQAEVKVEFQPEVIVKPKAPAKTENFWLGPNYPLIPPPGARPQIKPSFAGEYDSRPSVFQTFAKFLGAFVLIFIISYTLINGPALIKKMKYFWAIDYHNRSWATNFVIPTPQVNESRLLIPKINVNAPIIWNIPEDQIIKNLENGVVHYKDTALPGQTGNIFITGHSSYYIWSPGQYKDVFALLNQLSAGDKIYIQYNGVTFSYEVSSQQVVYPNEIEVLGSGKEKTLSLMTCVPVGTSLQRLVITAKQVPN